MSPGHCSCPDCGTILRIRDRSFIGRQIECPDCHVKLQIGQDQDRKLVAERVKTDPVRKPVASIAAKKAVQAGSAAGARLKSLLHSPLVLAWSLAIGITAFVAILMLRPAVRLRVQTKDPGPPAVATDPATNSGSPSGLPLEPAVVDSKEPAPPEMTAPATGASDGKIAEKTAPDPSVPAVTETIPVAPAPTAPSTTIPAGPDPKPVRPAPVIVDVESLLKQRLQKFSTSQPVSRAELIELVEEMLGAPIRYNREELGEKNLDRPVSVDLETTTVGGVLKALLDPVGWEYVIENNGLKLKPRMVAGTS